MDQERKLNVFEISRMATHNGPGIRTMVHFKGCNLSCQWCSTPESRPFVHQLSFFRKRCISCGACVNVCPQKAIQLHTENGIQIDRKKCDHCFACTEACCSTALSVIGKLYSAEELYQILIRDKNLYSRSGGGITFSGGEALLHVSDEMIRLLEKLKTEEISVGFDTAGLVEQKVLDRILPYTDFFLWDIKLMDEELHKKYIGQSNEKILKNLRYVDGRGVDLYIRCPVIPGINDNDSFFHELLSFVKQLKSVKEINLLPFHQLGASRYEKIGMKDPYSDMKDVSRDYIAEKQQLFINEGITTKMIG